MLTAIGQWLSFINEVCESLDDGEDTTFLDAEGQCHDLLNNVKDSTKQCAQNPEGGLIQSLETELSIGVWNSGAITYNPVARFSHSRQKD